MAGNPSPATGTEFTLSLHTASTLTAGTHSGTLEIRACKDAACANPWEGTGATLAYSLNIATVAAWETYQRDAAHRGYVPIWLNPSQFAEAWTWKREASSEPLGGINGVTAKNGTVYITRDVYAGEGVLYALNERSGVESWRVSFGVVPSLGPSAISGNTVYTTVEGAADSFLWAFAADTGQFLYKTAFGGQWPSLLAATAYGGRVYIGAGSQGGVIYAYSVEDGTRVWTHSSSGAWDMFTPAVDDQYVYHHNGLRLFLIDPASGITVKSISDPFGSSNGYSYHGAPMLGGRHNVVSFAGDAFNGSASNSKEQYDSRVLSSFDITNATYEWSTSHAYLTTPAVAKGIIYAARNNPMSLDALDETTGSILWSWAPTGKGDTSFHRNIVVTNNLLFVSTDKAVYALDLTSKLPVWSYPKPGMLALSENRTLLIATGATISDGGLVAVKLN